MKRVLITLILGVAFCVPAFSQGTAGFSVNFSPSPPPHTPGVPESGALLTGDLFSAAIYLGNTPPTSGRIVELGDGGALLPVFNFSGLVFASYPPGVTAYSYEQSWSLGALQTQSLMEGRWYVQVSYADSSSYLGQIVPVPEPTGLDLLVTGSVALAAMARGRFHR